jgi:hypothetical protein
MAHRFPFDPPPPPRSVSRWSTWIVVTAIVAVVLAFCVTTN